jgi:hypothetical protein
VLCGGTQIIVTGLRPGGPVTVTVDYEDGSRETITVTVEP